MPVAAPHTSASNAYNPPRASEVYTLGDANSSIPSDIRAQFHRDEFGKIIFYTAPPLDVNPLPEETRTLGHSLRYLADKARNKEELEKKRKDRAEQLEIEASEKMKRMKVDGEDKKEWILEQKVKALSTWGEQMEKGTDELYKQMYGENWQEMRTLHLQKLALEQEEIIQKKKAAEVEQRVRAADGEIKIKGFKF